MFEDAFRVPDTQLKTQLRRSRIKDYIPDKNDEKLRQWLEDWRRKTSIELYGVHSVKHFGFSNVMTDHTLSQICDAAHQNLIMSTDDLYKETRWHFIYQYGQTVVGKIREIKPVVPLPVKTTTARKCSKCGQPGHNSEFIISLLRYSHSSNFQIIERSPHCPGKHDLVGETPNHGTTGVHPSNSSTASFRIEPVPHEAGPSNPIVHYSRMRLGNITNCE